MPKSDFAMGQSPLQGPYQMFKGDTVSYLVLNHSKPDGLNHDGY